jgi:hypothetical protein
MKAIPAPASKCRLTDRSSRRNQHGRVGTVEQQGDEVDDERCRQVGAIPRRRQLQLERRCEHGGQDEAEEPWKTIE